MAASETYLFKGFDLETACARASETAKRNHMHISPDKPKMDIHKIGAELLVNTLGPEFHVVAKPSKSCNVKIYRNTHMAKVRLLTMRDPDKWMVRDIWLEYPDTLFVCIDFTRLDKPRIGLLTSEQMAGEVAEFKTCELMNGHDVDNRNDDDETHYVGPYWEQVFQQEYLNTTDELKTYFRSVL
jgi:hypothetical protein